MVRGGLQSGSQQDVAVQGLFFGGRGLASGSPGRTWATGRTWAKPGLPVHTDQTSPVIYSCHLFQPTSGRAVPVAKYFEHHPCLILLSVYK